MTAAEQNIGAKMPDGTVYAGISPNTGEPMCAAPADVGLTMTFKMAKEYAAMLDAHGHKDWRVPTKKELNVLFNNRALLRGFNSGSHPARWYWSATPFIKWFAWCQRFSDGYQDMYPIKGYHSSVRLVRTDARRVSHRAVHPKVT